MPRRDMRMVAWETLFSTVPSTMGERIRRRHFSGTSRAPLKRPRATAGLYPLHGPKVGHAPV